jgi:hypothetical protein
MSDEKSAAQAELAKTCEAADVWVGHVYRHWDEGGEYVVFAVTLDEATLEPLVSYYSLKRQTRWTRKLTVFTAVINQLSRRFERVRLANFEEIAAALGIDLTVNHGIVIRGGHPPERVKPSEEEATLRGHRRPKT